MIALVDGRGLSRRQAQEVIEKHIEGVVISGTFPAGFDLDWFLKLGGRTGLPSTYDEKHLSLKNMRKLAIEPDDDIPPIPKIP